MTKNQGESKYNLEALEVDATEIRALLVSVMNFQKNFSDPHLRQLMLTLHTI